MKANRKKMIKAEGTVLFCIYLILLLKFTVFRSGFSIQHPFAHAVVNLRIFFVYWVMLQGRTYATFIYQFFGNIVWFVPFGMLAPCLTKKPLPLIRTTFYGLMLSFCIELSQAAFGTGRSEIDDLILNTTGVLLGYLVFHLLLKPRLRKAETASAGEEASEQAGPLSGK